ncbi:MAG: hypothetical protein AVDCRST_MAG48-1357, partial [uncultured Friedmanniella sp.]
GRPGTRLWDLAHGPTRGEPAHHPAELVRRAGRRLPRLPEPVRRRQADGARPV